MNCKKTDLILIDSYGREGQGEEYWTIWQFPNAQNIMIRFNAEYQSYNGAEYYNMDLVEPREVLVTQYFTIS